MNFKFKLSFFQIFVSFFHLSFSFLLISFSFFRLIEALGAEIKRTPSEVPSNHPSSHISLAKKLQEEIPDSIILDQYSNPGKIFHFLISNASNFTFLMLPTLHFLSFPFSNSFLISRQLEESL